MSNLSKRVQKSKSLKFNPVRIHHGNVMYGTTSHNHEHHYQVVLSKERETSPFGDKQISHDTIVVTCYQAHQPVCDCPGNSNSTICYHGLGAVRYHLAQKGATVSFCQNIFDAIRLRKSGQSLVKIVSAQGQAVLWGVVGRQAKIGAFVVDEVSIPKNTKITYPISKEAVGLYANVQAMRLSPEEAEGID